MRKLLLSKKLYNSLKNLEFQSRFLDASGLDRVADWLQAIDEGVYPNITLV